MKRIGKRLASVDLVAALLGVLLGVTPIPAAAHRGHDERVKVRVADREVRVEASVDPAALSVFDDDGDGTVQVREIVSRPTEIEAWLDERIGLVGTSGRPYEPSFADAPIEGFSNLSSESPVGHLSVIRRYPLRGDEERLLLKVDLFGRRGPSKPYVVVAGSEVRRGVLDPGSPVLSLR